MRAGNNIGRNTNGFMKPVNPWKRIWLSKDDGVSAIVVAAILVVIAVILALIFKDYIVELMSTVFEGVNEKINAELGH